MCQPVQLNHEQSRRVDFHLVHTRMRIGMLTSVSLSVEERACVGSCGLPHGSGGWKPKTKLRADSGSGENLLPGILSLVSCGGNVEGALGVLQRH